MKILLCSNMFPTLKHPVSGVFIKNQVCALSKNFGVKFKLSSNSSSPQNFLYKTLKYLLLFIKSILNSFNSFDIIHVHYGSAVHLMAVSPAIFFKKKPLVITFHGSDLNSLSPKGFSYKIVRYFVNITKAIIVVNNIQKNKLINEFSVNSDKIFVINVGCDLSLFKPLPLSKIKQLKLEIGLPSNKFILLFVGHIKFLKGLDILFKALKNISFRSDILALIIGDGPDLAELQSLAKKLKLEDIILWYGSILNTELPNLYSIADAFILPSRTEGTPTVILEAMASGTTIIASDVGGIPEVIKNGISGLLFNSENYYELKNCLEKIFFDKSLRKILAINALRDIQTHSIDTQVKKIFNIYENILL